MPYKNPIADKRIIVVGGSSGIGLALATALVHESAGSVLIASSNETKLQAAVKSIRADAPGAKGSIESKVIDLKSEKAVHSFFDSVGSLDALVITAGDSLQYAEAPGIQASKDMFDVRFFGALWCAQAAAKIMNKGGSITFTVGSLWQHPIKGFSMASSLCGSVVSMTKGLALDLAPLRVNVVAPGFVDTPLWDSMDPAQKEGMLEAQRKRLPVGFVAKAEDVVEAYLYLVKCPYVTGETINVDGGVGLL